MDDLNMEMKIHGGIDAIGNQANNARRYYVRPNNKKVNPRLMHFRAGEILQGKILSAKGDGIGLVRLPSGDFTCQLHEGLLPGDDLFFKIVNIEPSLTLRVHAVMSYVKGKKHNRKDIVRILDLPDNELYLSASDVFLTFKNMIFKDDLLTFYKFYSRVPNAEKYDVDSISRTLFWLAESGLHFEYDIFQLAYTYFNGLKNIEQHLNNLFLKIYPTLSDTFKNLLQPYRRDYLGLDNAIDISISLFSRNNLPNKPCFLELMQKLSVPSISEILEGIPNIIVDFIESMNIWNSMCTGSEAAYHWTFPLPFRQNTTLVTLVFRSQFNVQKLFNLPLGSSIQRDIDVGNILSQMFGRYSDELSNLLSENENPKQILPKIEHYFTNNGLILLAIHFYDGKLLTIESSGGSVLSSNKSISFVV